MQRTSAYKVVRRMAIFFRSEMAGAKDQSVDRNAKKIKPQTIGLRFIRRRVWVGNKRILGRVMKYPNNNIPRISASPSI
jgi:hypothetical protein